MHKKVLVIGSGSIANKHIKILKKNNYTVYVYSKNKNFKNIKSKVSLLKNFDFLPKVDFAVIANETYKHLEFIKILAEKKINIYCEKPLYHKKINFNILRNLIKKNKIIFFTGYQLLQDTKIKFLKNFLKKNKVKSYIVKVGHDFEKWRLQKPSKKNYFTSMSKGGGVIFELIHEINLIQNLFGDISSIKSYKSKSLKFKCEDTAVSIIKNKDIIGLLYQDMFSKIFFRNITIITLKKDLVELDFIGNFIKINRKLIKFKESNQQLNLIEKNLKMMNYKIRNKDFSIKYFDDSVKDLMVCLKMHLSKHT